MNYTLHSKTKWFVVFSSLIIIIINLRYIILNPNVDILISTIVAIGMIPFVDTAIWHLCGKQVISLQEKFLSVQYRNRIFCVSKNIQYDEIIDVYEEYEPIKWETFTIIKWYFGFDGGHVIISCYRGRLYLGCDMTRCQVKDLISDIQNHVKIYRANNKL